VPVRTLSGWLPRQTDGACGIIGPMNDGEWLTSREAQAYLGRTDRQLRRYAKAGRVRTQVQAGRVHYYRPDLDQLAASLPPDERPQAEPPVQIVPAGDLMNMVQDLQAQLQQAAAREGYLRAQLDQRPRLEDQAALQAELAQVKAERDTLQAQLAALQGGRQRDATLALLGLAVVLALAVAVVFLVLTR